MNRGLYRPNARPRKGGLWSTVGGVNYASAVAATSIIGQTIAYPAAANTLTGWTQLVASTPFAACEVTVTWAGLAQNTNATGILIDIGTGAAASEVVLIDGIPDYGHAWNRPAG